MSTTERLFGSALCKYLVRGVGLQENMFFEKLNKACDTTNYHKDLSHETLRGASDDLKNTQNSSIYTTDASVAQTSRAPYNLSHHEINFVVIGP